ncbi:MAG: DUF2927 domain-containing protein [Pseudomonadota bacterium]
MPAPNRLTALLGVLALSACVTVPPSATPPPPEADRAAQAPVTALAGIARFPARAAPPPSRGNAAMARDFRDLAFRMESGRTLPVLSRFEGPITVRVAPGAPPGLTADLDALITRLRGEAGIDITRTAAPAASINIETLPRARLQRVVPQAACFVVPRVASWAEFRRARGSDTLDWTTLIARERVAVFIPDDVAPQEIRDCLHEEIGQAIGPLNDLYRLPDSVFNDDNFHAVLTGFDMLILRAYYDPSLSAGMSEAEVTARLPAILDRLNPGGRGRADPVAQPTPRSWVDLIETALGPGTSPTARRQAAEQALAFAQANGWSDTRLGFSYFALGRLSLGRSTAEAVTAFEQASVIFEAAAPGSIQSAQIDMQLAAFALSAGEWPRALALSRGAQPAAARAENAALLATLLMVEAQALDRLGRPDEAAGPRMDSVAWARYGFGSMREVEARLSEISALAAN